MVFHFNKAHLTNPEIPMWVLKVKGQTHYIHHLNCFVGFTTRETPDNPHTKGSLRLKGNLKIEEINSELIATVD